MPWDTKGWVKYMESLTDILYSDNLNEDYAREWRCIPYLTNSSPPELEVSLQVPVKNGFGLTLPATVYDSVDPVPFDLSMEINGILVNENTQNRNGIRCIPFDVTLRTPTFYINFPEYKSQNDVDNLINSLPDEIKVAPWKVKLKFKPMHFPKTLSTNDFWKIFEPKYQYYNNVDFANAPKPSFHIYNNSDAIANIPGYNTSFIVFIYDNTTVSRTLLEKAGFIFDIVLGSQLNYPTTYEYSNFPKVYINDKPLENIKYASAQFVGNLNAPGSYILIFFAIDAYTLGDDAAFPLVPLEYINKLTSFTQSSSGGNNNNNNTPPPADTKFPVWGIALIVGAIITVILIIVIVVVLVTSRGGGSSTDTDLVTDNTT